MIIGASQYQNSLDTAQRLVDLKTSLSKLEYTIVTHLHPITEHRQFIDYQPPPNQISDKLTHVEILRNINRRYRLVIRKILNINSNVKQKEGGKQDSQEEDESQQESEENELEKEVLVFLIG